MSRAAQFMDSLETLSDIAVKLLAVIPVVSERQVDLAERQVRMLKVQLFGAPPIRLLLDDQLHDLYRRADDTRDPPILVQRYMFVACVYSPDDPSHKLSSPERRNVAR